MHAEPRVCRPGKDVAIFEVEDDVPEQPQQPSPSMSEISSCRIQAISHCSPGCYPLVTTGNLAPLADLRMSCRPGKQSQQRRLILSPGFKTSATSQMLLKRVLNLMCCRPGKDVAIFEVEDDVPEQPQQPSPARDSLALFTSAPEPAGVLFAKLHVTMCAEVSACAAGCAAQQLLLKDCQSRHSGPVPCVTAPRSSPVRQSQQVSLFVQLHLYRGLRCDGFLSIEQQI